MSKPPKHISQMNLAEAREQRQMLFAARWTERLHPRKGGKFARKFKMPKLSSVGELGWPNPPLNKSLFKNGGWVIEMGNRSVSYKPGSDFLEVQASGPRAIPYRIPLRKGKNAEETFEAWVKAKEPAGWLVPVKKGKKVDRAEALGAMRRGITGFSESREEVKMSEATTEEVVETPPVTTDPEPEPDERLTQALSELDDLRQEVRRTRIDKKIEVWQKAGYDPALLKKVKSVLLAADDGPVLQLSEEEGEPVLSLSEVIDQIMDVLPKPDMKLAEQHRQEEEGEHPDEDTEVPVADRALAAAKELGDESYLKSAKSE